jgi:hypothetical protein
MALYEGNVTKECVVKATGLAHLYAALQGASAHLGNELQRAAQLLPGATQGDHGGVRVGVAQAL